MTTHEPIMLWIKFTLSFRKMDCFITEKIFSNGIKWPSLQRPNKLTPNLTYRNGSCACMMKPITTKLLPYCNKLAKCVWGCQPLLHQSNIRGHGSNFACKSQTRVEVNGSGKKLAHSGTVTRMSVKSFQSKSSRGLYH